MLSSDWSGPGRGGWPGRISVAVCLLLISSLCVSGEVAPPPPRAPAPLPVPAPVPAPLPQATQPAPVPAPAPALPGTAPAVQAPAVQAPAVPTAPERPKIRYWLD